MTSLIQCQICSGELAPPRTINHGKLSLCKECGARFLEPSSATTYDGRYYDSWFGEPGQYIQRLKRENFRHLLQHYKKPLVGIKLLDIGCATGFLMDEARSQGAKVAGLDVNPWATEQARKLLPEAAIYTGHLHDSLTGNFFTPESFDIITATDVIEHVDEIKPLFRDILRLLTSEGTAIFTLPDPESFSARTMGNTWFQYKAEHVTYLTRKSLKILAEELGFNIEQIKPHRKILTLEYLANVLTYHNRGWLSKLGWMAGKSAKLFGLARIPLHLGTGEMLVKINKQTCRESRP